MNSHLVIGRILRSSGAASALMGAIAILLPVAPLRAQTLDEQAVLAPIHALFDGLAKGDRAAILAPLTPNGGATLYRGGQFLQLSLNALVDRLAAIVNAGPAGAKLHLENL